MTSISTGHEDLHCAAQTGLLGETPSGTAGGADQIVLVQLPLPWPKKIDAHPALSGLELRPPGAGKTQLLAISSTTAPADNDDVQSSDPVQSDGRLMVVCYSRQTGQPFARFERRETLLESSQLLGLLRSVIAGDLTRIGPVMTDEVADLLICTHGSRDRCCGQSGTLLFMELEDELTGAGTDHGTRKNDSIRRTRLWRSSHLGGHRFAPTAMTLPDGLTWSNMDSAVMLGVLDQSLSPEEAHDHLRGGIGLMSAPVQIADGLAFVEFGWPWLNEPRSWQVSENLLSSTEEQITTVTLSSSVGRGTVELAVGERLPIPACGQPLDQATKFVDQWVVVRSRFSER